MAKFQGAGNPAPGNFDTQITNQTNGLFLPQVYSKKVQNFFRKASVVEAITNTDYAGEISSFGDSVQIIKEPEIDVYAYTRGADTTQTLLTDEETSLVVNSANAFKFIVDDIESKMSHVNFKEVAASSAAYALKDSYDSTVLASMFAGVSSGAASTPDNVVGADAADDVDDLDDTNAGTKPIDIGGAGGSGVDPLDVMARLARLLDEQNVPEEGRYFVAPPWFYEQLSQSGSKLLSVDFNAGQGSIRNGLVSSGKLRGFEMYKSNNCPAATQSGAVNQVLAGHMSAVSTAQTIVNTEVLRDPSSFGDICRGLHVFGSKVLRPEALAKAYVSTLD